MFRIFVAVIAVALIALPSILICLKWRAPMPARLLLAGAAFVAPLLMIWGIHLVPAFNGTAESNPSFWRGVGVLLSAATLIVPWLIYTAVREKLE
jgi:protein-S-isoprenylcysteine O-methyltransferase Ste14